MRRELGLLNIICIFVAFGFLVMAAISVISSGDFLTIDNLFIITFSLVMALTFLVTRLLYLNSQQCLPLPRLNQAKSVASLGGAEWGQIKARPQAPPLLDAKGRAV